MDHIDDLRPNSGAFSGKNFLARITLILGNVIGEIGSSLFNAVSIHAPDLFFPLNGFVFF